MADPSIEAKQELTEIGNDCVRDLGVACRSMIRNSAVRENLNKTTKDFVTTDAVVSTTNATLIKLARTMGSLNEQYVKAVTLILTPIELTESTNGHVPVTNYDSFGEIPKIAEALQECHDIAQRKQIPNMQALSEQYTATSYSKDSENSEH